MAFVIAANAAGCAVGAAVDQCGGVTERVFDGQDLAVVVGHELKYGRSP